MEFVLPKPVREIGEALIDAGFEAYLVGGCVRDILLKRTIRGELVEPKDWDIATNATPEKVQEIFALFGEGTKDDPATVYENDFGTVGIKTGSEDPKLAIVEVTTYRNEGKYTDKRHPDEVRFAKTIEEDLSRRDLTVNAMALRIERREASEEQELKGPSSSLASHRSLLIDPYDGEVDLQKKIIRTVGDPDARFGEDALRLMRAVRFATELEFTIEEETAKAIKKHAPSLADIAAERVRDELSKLLMAREAAKGVQMLEDLGLLKYILPELREGIGIGQNLHHIYTVWEHNLYALDYAAKENYSLVVRMASLLHDVGKPKSKRGEGSRSTFYGHEVIGARMAVKALDRLKFSRDFVDKVAHLVRRHMFYYNVGDVSPAGVRRFLVRVGPENIDDLLKVREADRIGSGVKKAIPYKLRHLLFMIEKVKHDPVSVKMLKVTGEDVMRIADIPPSRKVGDILAALLDEVLDEPEGNTKESLELRISNLAKLSEEELAKLRKSAEAKQEEMEVEAEEEMKKKHRVS